MRNSARERKDNERIYQRIGGWRVPCGGRGGNGGDWVWDLIATLPKHILYTSDAYCDSGTATITFSYRGDEYEVGTCITYDYPFCGCYVVADDMPQVKNLGPPMPFEVPRKAEKHKPAMPIPWQRQSYYGRR